MVMGMKTTRVEWARINVYLISVNLAQQADCASELFLTHQFGETVWLEKTASCRRDYLP